MGHFLKTFLLKFRSDKETNMGVYNHTYLLAHWQPEKDLPRQPLFECYPPTHSNFGHSHIYRAVDLYLRNIGIIAMADV